MQRLSGAAGGPRVADDVTGVRVRLLDGFGLIHGEHTVALSPGAQRLLAFLALRDHPAPRSLVAGRLWPELGEEGALACLRSSLWRLRQRSCLVVESGSGHLRLADTVSVDVRDMCAQAQRLLDADGDLEARDEDIDRLRGELLPDWWEEWVIVERERLRQLRLHALEALAARLAGDGRFARALDVALAASAVEPLRESPHRSVVAIHLAEGNRSEALRSYYAYRDMLRLELGVTPSPAMEALVAVLRAHGPSHDLTA